MSEQDAPHPVERLEAFVGEWAMRAVFPRPPGGGEADDAAPSGGEADDGARTLFEWLPDRRFLVQRWAVPHPAAPDGIAIIGFDDPTGAYVQHYFDSRGVARLYEMTFADGVWTLSRTAADFSPLNFSQRYTGVFSEDRREIRGRWEIATEGSDWKLDFELSYTKLGR